MNTLILLVSGDAVKHVHEMKYLGHSITDSRADTLVEPMIRDFNTKVNSFLSDFKRVKSEVKNNLFFKYCTSYYGSNMCNFCDSHNMEKLYVQWRKTIRRIWNLPYRAHRRFLPLISKAMPPDVLLHDRFIIFLIVVFSQRTR